MSYGYFKDFSGQLGRHLKKKAQGGNLRLFDMLILDARVRLSKKMLVNNNNNNNKKKKKKKKKKKNKE